MGAFRLLQATVAAFIPFALLVGCSSMPNTPVASVAAGESPSKATFEGFRIKSTVMAKDGGSIFIYGELADSTAVSLKLDNGLSSTTKGLLLIQMKPPSGATAQEMRRVTPSEAAMLIPILERASEQSSENANRTYLQSILNALRSVRD